MRPHPPSDAGGAFAGQRQRVPAQQTPSPEGLEPGHRLVHSASTQPFIRRAGFHHLVYLLGGGRDKDWDREVFS